MVGWILLALQATWDFIQLAADYAIVILTYAYNVLKTFASAIWDAAKFTYEDLLKPIGQWLHDGYERLKTIYDAVVAPVVQWAKRLTDAIRAVYKAYFQPILDAIDATRRILELLATFHVQFAVDLDKALAQLEAKITGPIQEVIGVINHYVNLFESYVLAGNFLFRRATFFGSIQRDIRSIQNLGLNHLFSTLTPKQLEGSTGVDDYTPPDERLSVFDSITAGDDDASGIDVEGALQMFEAMARGEPISMWTAV